VYHSFSPDGQSLVFIANGSRRTVLIAGGVAQTVADSTSPTPGSWGDGRQILYGFKNALWLVSSDGGDRRMVAGPDSSKGIRGYAHPARAPRRHPCPHHGCLVEQRRRSIRGRPAGLPDLSRAHADHRVHHPGLGDRPDPRAPPRPRGGGQAAARRPAVAGSAIAPYVRRRLDRARLKFLSCIWPAPLTTNP